MFNTLEQKHHLGCGGKSKFIQVKTNEWASVTTSGTLFNS